MLNIMHNPIILYYVILHYILYYSPEASWRSWATTGGSSRPRERERERGTLYYKYYTTV